MSLSEIVKNIPKGAKLRVSQVYLECKEGTSNKFYRTVVVTNVNSPTLSSSFTSNYGSIGLCGQVNSMYELTETKAFFEERKKVHSKKRKGYVEAECPESRNLGCVGEYNQHMFGLNSKKDEVFLIRLESLFGHRAEFERILFRCNIYEGTFLSSEEIERQMEAETAAKAFREVQNRERLQAVESERLSTYSASWGEWT